MSYKVGEDRQQTTLLPSSLDEYVSEESICRVIDAFVEHLDMVKLDFKYATPAEVGCRPYNPKMMLKLYIYGFLNRIRSSRRLEAETQRNVEVMWLMEKLIPDDRTICNFRKDNAKALKSTFRVFSKMCNQWGLYGKEVIAVDGTKIRANNSRKNNHNLEIVNRELERLEKKITEYMKSLEENDKADENEKKISTENIKGILKKLNDKKAKFDDLLKQIQENDGKEVSTVDKDARLMKQGGNAGLDVCYNVQSVVDSKYNLIVDIDVSNKPVDFGELNKMSEKAKEIMEVSEITLVADKGYYDGADISKCEENGTECIVAKPKESHQPDDENYFRNKFQFDKEKNVYICPEKTELNFIRKCEKKKKTYDLYANYSACRVCPNKGKCTKSEKGREIYRGEHQDVMDIVDKRYKENYGIYKKRQEIVEHPFGTIKRIWGFGNFLCRGLEKVTGEASLAFMSYNLRRVINIMGAKQLITSIG